MPEKDKTISQKSKTISHIAIIMDGNRRYAKKKGMLPGKGHEAGAKKLLEVLEWCKEFDIKELTLYTFSVQNFNRTAEEKAFLFSLFKTYFKKLKNEKKFFENKVRVRIIGRKHMFPEDVQKVIADVEEKTKEHDKFILNFAMAYGGREEIIDATKKIAEDVRSNKLNIDDINENVFAQKLYLSSEPEIVIRTAGDRRTSNFLPWQTIYSEWFFPEQFWPEFSKEDFIRILDEFKNRERRYGK